MDAVGIGFLQCVGWGLECVAWGVLAVGVTSWSALPVSRATITLSSTALLQVHAQAWSGDYLVIMKDDLHDVVADRARHRNHMIKHGTVLGAYTGLEEKTPFQSRRRFGRNCCSLGI